MAYGKSIELFLANGTVDSLVTAELSNWNGKAIKIPRIEVVTTEGFVVFAGATVNEKTSEKSLCRGAVTLRKKHFDAGRVKELKTTEDILFSSSSADADFVTGYSVSGPAGLVS